MKPLNKKWIGLWVILLGVGLGWYLLKNRWKEPELPYKAPNLGSMDQAPIEQTKYEEYAAILAQKQKSSNKPKQSLVRFGLAKLFKPQILSKPTKPIKQPSPSKRGSPHKKPSQKSSAPTYFFAYQGAEKAAINTATEPQPHFFKARVYKAQKVRDQGAVVVKLQEKLVLADKTLPAGTLLFGAAQFGKDRMYVSFTVAKWQEAHIPVQLQGYDQDLLLGFSAPGLVPSISEQVEGKVLQKAMEYSGSQLLEDLGKGAIDTFRTVKKKKEAFLEDRKGVYVRVVNKNKS